MNCVSVDCNMFSLVLVYVKVHFMNVQTAKYKVDNELYCVYCYDQSHTQCSTKQTQHYFTALDRKIEKKSYFLPIFWVNLQYYKQQ